MHKEIVISIIIVIAIILGNILTQGYIKKSVEETNQKLSKLRVELLKEEKQKDEVEKQIEEIHGKWDECYNIMAYFIEHDELEKVETQLQSIKGNVEIEEYAQAVPELDKCIYLLNHVKDKEALMIQNIF